MAFATLSWISVYPSAGACTTCSVARLLEAPTRFSTTNCCPSRSEPLGEPLSHQARGEVAAAAGRKADDEPHRPRRITLHPSDAWRGRQRGGGRGQTQECAAGKLHAHLALRRAVTSISIFMRGSDRAALIMVAAGLTLPRYSLSAGQQGSKSSRLGNM